MKLQLIAKIVKKAGWWSISPDRLHGESEGPKTDEVCGDLPADIVDDWLSDTGATRDQLMSVMMNPKATLRKAINDCWMDTVGRFPTQRELEYLVKFCTSH
jgi:hypothetical protein